MSVKSFKHSLYEYGIMDILSHIETPKALLLLSLLLLLLLLFLWLLLLLLLLLWLLILLLLKYCYIETPLVLLQGAHPRPLLLSS